MKNALLFFCLVFNCKSIAQVSTAMPADADAFYQNAMPIINSQVRNLVVKSASDLKNQQVNADSLIKALHSKSILKGMKDENIAAVSTLIMVQASMNADEDLKKMVLSMRNNGKNDAEAVQKINDQKLVLDLILYRKSKMAEEVSLVIKKIYDNSENIINNLR
ncbi:MAG: hypothetical protein ABJA90_02690 [Ginsengibacter sp.]